MVHVLIWRHSTANIAVGCSENRFSFLSAVCMNTHISKIDSFINREKDVPIVPLIPLSGAKLYFNEVASITEISVTNSQ